MNKETWEIIKKLVDSFVDREELLKELLKDKENKVVELEKEIKESDDFYNGK